MTVVELRPGVSEAIKDAQTLPPERILEAARKLSFTSIAIVGRETSGSLYIAANVRADSVIALIARAHQFLVSHDDDLGVIDNLDDPPVLP